MVKFKLKIFRSCRSKDPSTLPDPPVPLFPRPQQPHRSSFKSHVSSAFGCASKSAHCSDSDYFRWQDDDDQWHVVANIYDVVSPRRKIYNSSVSEVDSRDGGDVSDDAFPLPLQLQLPLLTVTEKKKRRRSRKVKLNKPRRSVSSGESLVFSSEYSINCNDVVLEDETETLISSSRSFSTDTSTEYNPQLETIRESACVSLADRYKKKRGAWRTRDVRNSGGTGTMLLSEYGTPARLSVFKKVIGCDVEGKMKESYAMVKRTEDPYEDFKRSMMEMIVEKRMYEERELEQLLECYLSLNSRVHHGVIVEVFEEIWDTMFGGGDD